MSKTGPLVAVGTAEANSVGTGESLGATLGDSIGGGLSVGASDGEANGGAVGAALNEGAALLGAGVVMPSVGEGTPGDALDWLTETQPTSTTATRERATSDDFTGLPSWRRNSCTVAPFDDGTTITLIRDTTENPYYEINSPMTG